MVPFPMAWQAASQVIPVQEYLIQVRERSQLRGHWTRQLVIAQIEVPKPTYLPHPGWGRPGQCIAGQSKMLKV